MFVTSCLRKILSSDYRWHTTTLLCSSMDTCIQTSTCLSTSQCGKQPRGQLFQKIVPKKNPENKQIENIEDFSTQLSLSLKTFGPRFYGAVEKICPRSLRRLLWKCPAIIWQHKTKNLIKTSQNIPVKNRRNKKRRERGKQFLADSYGLNVFVFMFNQIWIDSSGNKQC